MFSNAKNRLLSGLERLCKNRSEHTISLKKKTTNGDGYALCGHYELRQRTRQPHLTHSSQEWGQRCHEKTESVHYLADKQVGQAESSVLDCLNRFSLAHLSQDDAQIKTANTRWNF